MNVEKEAEEILNDIDERGGMERCNLNQWIEFLEVLHCEVEIKLQAAKEDLKAREGEERSDG